ncbi:MAG: PilZ domain-containing protein [Actinobacteria bacterium]|nr:PilZ domain-containing protein [Actinomycetota bacterium]
MEREGIGPERYVTIMAALLLQMIFFALPVQAETNWNEVSKSINNSLSGNDVFSMKNILALFLTILIFFLVYQIFKMSWKREEKRSYERRRSRISLRPLAPQQKRYWFRLKTDSEFEWATAEEASKARKINYKKDRLVDLSGGGLCFITLEQLNAGDDIKLLLDIGRGKPLSLDGHVVRVDEITRQDNTMQKVSVQFGEIVEGERDRIVSLIMNRQRDSIQTEKMPPAQSQ